MISARTTDVHRAVALIGPDEHRRAECVNAVHVALTEIAGTDADLRRAFDSRTKRAKRAANRLHKAAARLQETLADPDLPEYLCNFFPPSAGSIIRKTIDGHVSTVMLPIALSGGDESLEWGRDETKRWLTLWLKRIGAAARAKSEKPFQPKAMKKLLAAEQAHRLLRQFNRDIATTDGSTFCRLAALLHGTPKASFTRPCWLVSRDAKRWAEMPKLRPVKK